MQNFKIREMTHGDVDDILQIEEKCYGEHHWSRESFETELSNKISTYRCVINSQNKCVGYMGIWKIVDEKWWKEYDRKANGIIYSHPVLCKKMCLL